MAKKNNILLYGALAVGGYLLYKKMSAPPAMQTAVPGSPQNMMVTQSTPSFFKASTPGPDPMQQAVLQKWASSSPNPAYMNMVNSLNADDTASMYIILTKYFDTNTYPVPQNLQDVWDRVTKPWGI